jgi:hypothetical protein
MAGQFFYDAFGKVMYLQVFFNKPSTLIQNIKIKKVYRKL